MYESVELAKYIINKCISDEAPISNLQLQKIMYLIQREYLRRGDIAFLDDIEAWQFGPAIPNVYDRFCGHGAMPITFTYDRDVAPISIEDREIIDPIVAQNCVLPPWDLLYRVHPKDSAWDKTYRDGAGMGYVIPIELIREEAIAQTSPCKRTNKFQFDMER